jgi:hypothetical protein
VYTCLHALPCHGLHNLERIIQVRHGVRCRDTGADAGSTSGGNREAHQAVTCSRAMHGTVSGNNGVLLGEGYG